MFFKTEQQTNQNTGFPRSPDRSQVARLWLRSLTGRQDVAVDQSEDSDPGVELASNLAAQSDVAF